MSTITRGCYLIAAVLMTVGLFVRFDGAASSAPAGLRRPAAQVRASQPPVQKPRVDYTEEIVAANIFSKLRAAPPARVTFDEFGEDASMSSSAAPEPAGAPPPPRAIPVSGIGSGPQGAWVLMDVDPAVYGAELYRVGDVTKEGKVLEISETSVTIETPTGPRVLYLPQPSRR